MITINGIEIGIFNIKSIEVSNGNLYLNIEKGNALNLYLACSKKEYYKRIVSLFKKGGFSINDVLIKK